MWERYAWFAYPAFGLCLVGTVASYLWDDDYLVWPTLFGIAAFLVMAPLLLVRPLRAVLQAMRTDAESSTKD
jgi:hypothetical protein